MGSWGRRNSPRGQNSGVSKFGVDLTIDDLPFERND